MRLSARNIIKGIIKQITPGAINTDVVVDVGNGIDIVAQVSKSSVDHLGLGVGKPAYAVINIDDVIMGVDD